MRFLTILTLIHVSLLLTGCVCGDGLDPRCAIWCDKNDHDCYCEWCLPQDECAGNKCLVSKGA